MVIIPLVPLRLCVTPDNKIVSGSEDLRIGVWDLERVLLLERVSRVAFENQEKAEEIWTILSDHSTGTKDGQRCVDELITVCNFPRRISLRSSNKWTLCSLQ